MEISMCLAMKRMARYMEISMYLLQHIRQKNMEISMYLGKVHGNFHVLYGYTNKTYMET